MCTFVLMKKVIIAIDSFKGSLTSAEAGAAAAQGIHRSCPNCQTIVLPIADGGEGLLDVLIDIHQGLSINLQAHDPLMKLRNTRYALSADGNTAFIEMAAISGLPLVPVDKRNPWITTTYGTGELLRDALDRGCRNFILGIGGSATNDAGLGLFQALGYRFYDAQGQLLGTGGQILEKVSYIDDAQAHPALCESHITVACDVRNPFYGSQGAAHVFARQKGADETMITQLDAGLRHLATIIETTRKVRFADHPGAGAAGGLGGTLLAFLHADLKPGADLLLQALHFQEYLKGADLVLTGEGKSDCQTLLGKVPFAILQAAQKQKLPTIILAGSVEDVPTLNQAGFQAVFSITPGPMSLQEAMRPEEARKNLEDTAAQIGALWNDFHK